MSWAEDLLAVVVASNQVHRQVGANSCEGAQTLAVSAHEKLAVLEINRDALAIRHLGRYRKLTKAGKPATTVTPAIARELSGLVWAIACQVSPR